MAEQVRHSLASPKGGLVLHSSEGNKKVIIEFAKALGKKLLTGSLKDIMRISRPASISYPKTYLQVIATDNVNIHMLEKAAASEDPVQRLQWVTTFLISALYINLEECQSRGPLNPVLGETYTGVKSNGTTIFCEQTCHHPPISNWQIYGKGFVYNGHGMLAAGLAGPNSLKASRKGANRITFDDGTFVEWDNPGVIISGLLYGERIISFTGSFTLDYKAFNLV